MRRMLAASLMLLSTEAVADDAAFTEERLKQEVPAVRDVTEYMSEGRRFLVLSISVPTRSMDEAMGNATVALRLIEANKHTFGEWGRKARSNPDIGDPDFDSIVLNVAVAGAAEFSVRYYAMPWREKGLIQPIDLLTQGIFGGANDKGAGYLYAWCQLIDLNELEVFCAGARPRFCRSTSRDATCPARW